MKKKLGYFAPEDLDRKTSWTNKVYFQAKLLSRFVDVTLYGYNVKPSNDYSCIDLNNFLKSENQSWNVYKTMILEIFKRRFDYVFLPTVFQPFFPLLFFASKIASSTIIYDARDPLAPIIQNMREQVHQRIGNKWIANFIIKFSPVVDTMLFRISDYLLGNSPSYIENITSRGGKDKTKGFLYYNHLPVDLVKVNFNTFPNKLKQAINEKKVVLVYFGKIQPHQRGLEVVLESLSLYKKNKVLLVLLGEIQDEAYWNILIEKLKISDKLCFLEPHPKPEAMYILSQFRYGIIGPHQSYYLPSKIFDHIDAGNILILPDKMIHAKEIAKTNCITYKNKTHLVEIINEISNTEIKSKPNIMNLPTMEEMLLSSFQKIFMRKR